jgi:DNA modification methylase
LIRRFATRSDFRGSGDEKSYSDKVQSSEFIEGLRERFIFMREILAEDGSIYVHLDYRKAHYLKVILDQLFDESNFVNQIIWKRTSAHSDSKTLGNAHDIILHFGKSTGFMQNKQFADYSDEYIKKYYKHKDEKGQFLDRDLTAKGLKGRGYDYEWKGIKGYWRCPVGTMQKHENTGLLYYTKKGTPRLKQYLHEMEGRPLQDVWSDINAINSQALERIDYPTQKPEILLERIILSSSNAGDLVMDVFAGSGTTAAVAEKLGRRWIICDFGKHAIYTMQKRMLRIGESKALGKDVKKNKKYGKPPKPFCVVSTGAYDFSRIMKLRENRDAYVDFVLGLFQISRDEKDLSGKYRLTNIFGEKDGHPVEVYPVWDDEYLKNIRIDEDYLKGIILQSGGKLKGNYYIITPETCTLIGDRVLKNSAGDEVYFKLLKFPYKILEDVSRNFQIQEQPSSQGNVNNLINSTGFYFNDNVEIEIEKTEEGLKIIRFETRILDKQGGRLKGLDGLAMLLVDIDYDGKIFDMDRTVFAKDIGENGEIKLAGLTESVAVIAIDKHGNESKPVILRR